MQLESRVDPIYFPEADQTTVMRLGLQPLSFRHWLHADADLPQFHSHKLEQHRLRPDSVYQTLPGCEPAVAELGSLILEHLQTHQQPHYAVTADRVTHRESGLNWPRGSDNLWEMSLWIQEDVCVLQEAAGSYQLTAASVCSPSNWDPASKLGRNLDEIHEPVPGYAASLSGRVDRLFHSLKPGKLWLRYNWSLQPGNELYWQSDPTHASGPVSHWRVERQTLLRLPQSGAVVFTIRLYLHPLNQLQADPRFAASLQQILSALPAAERRYKGLSQH